MKRYTFYRQILSFYRIRQNMRYGKHKKAKCVSIYKGKRISPQIVDKDLIFLRKNQVFVVYL